MATWEVSYAEKIWHTTEVEADTREEALAKAFDVISNGEPIQYDTEADGFLDEYEIVEL